MSHQATTHNHSSINFIPQTDLPLPTSLAAPVKPENDSDDDDVVFLATVPKVQHTPEEYDPECKCCTCRLVKKLLAECICAECKGSGQAGHSTENVTILKEVSLAIVQPSESSIQNNAASTSGLISGNDHDDRESRSSAPDYLPRFFDDESGDSSSDDSDNDDSIDDADDKESDQETESEDDGSDYAFSKPGTSKSLKKTRWSTNQSKTIVSEKSHKSPRCDRRFRKKANLRRHYRVIHQQLKSFYCKWTKCDFVSGKHDKVIDHITMNHFKNRKNAIQAKVYVGKRKLAHPNDPSLDSSIRIARLKNGQAVCSQCERVLPSEGHLKIHLDTHTKSGYRCTWPGCAFFYTRIRCANKHVCTDHLKVETASAQQINQHLVKVNPITDETGKVRISPKRSYFNASDSPRQSNSGSQLSPATNQQTSAPKDPAPRGLLKSCHAKRSIGQTDCPQCKRNLPERCLENHLRTHKIPGFRCAWPKCGFFFSELPSAKEHVCVDHLQVETINAQQTNQHLIKVNPRTGKIGKVQVRSKRSLNANDNSRPSTSGSSLVSVTNLQSTDDKSSYSSGIESDDSDNDEDNFDRTVVRSTTNQANSFNCPKCEISFTKKSKLLRHYRGQHLERKPFYCKWPNCNFAAGIHDHVVNHANRKHFNSDDRKQARSCVGIRKKSSSTEKDPIYESIRMMV